MKPLNNLTTSEIRILEHIISIEDYLKEELKKELSKYGRPNIEKYDNYFELLEKLRGMLNE